jgi:hypothetical protein
VATTAFYRLLRRHAWLAFLLLGASFGLFGLMTLNLFYVFGAAWDFLLANGSDAVMEGLPMELAELIVSAYAAVAFYVLFKVCEKALVARLSEGRPQDAKAEKDKLTP